MRSTSPLLVLALALAVGCASSTDEDADESSGASTGDKASLDHSVFKDQETGLQLVVALEASGPKPVSVVATRSGSTASVTLQCDMRLAGEVPSLSEGHVFTTTLSCDGPENFRARIDLTPDKFAIANESSSWGPIPESIRSVLGALDYQQDRAIALQMSRGGTLDHDPAALSTLLHRALGVGIDSWSFKYVTDPEDDGEVATIAESRLMVYGVALRADREVELTVASGHGRDEPERSVRFSIVDAAGRTAALEELRDRAQKALLVAPPLE
jgi:hypothetical protein